MIGTAVIDAQLEFDGFDFTGADNWHVLVLYDGMPAARVDLPSPGVVTGTALAEAALVRRADAERARNELIHRLRRRLGAEPSREPEPLRVSVVVCTHRRSHYLPDLLQSVSSLHPAPYEVIVVDNDPGSEDCRALVERTGFRYLREDRRGLDNARNAGLRAAQGDVVAFTDDDCVASPAWLASLERAFMHEGVAAVTGPVFPYLLDTPARVRMEHQASLARGLRRIAFDWQVISPLHAAAVGVGANMAIKRSALLELAREPFPPELDAGTETESGGDTYMLSRLLAAGERVIYEPEMFVFHQHRPDGSALSRAVLGYGVGLSAALTKLVVEEGELSAPRAWAWLIKQYLQTQRRRTVGRADAIETRLSWDYLRGGFLGTGRWRKALRTQGVFRLSEPARECVPTMPLPSLGEFATPIAPSVASSAEAVLPSIASGADAMPVPPTPPVPTDAVWLSSSEPDLADIASLSSGGSAVAEASLPPFSGPTVMDVALPPSGGGTVGPDEPAISVIVPTFRREQALGRCLRALAKQDVPPGSFEVIVVDDDDNCDVAAEGESSALYPFSLRRLRSAGEGAAAARNQGARNAAAPLLLFLDDDVVADAWLVRRHLQWHAQHKDEAALVGSYRPRPTSPNLAASVARLWWRDVFHLLEDACGMTFVGALTANLSIPRSVFDRVGGFSNDYSRQRREDWDWGLRMRRAGIPVAFDRKASARHEFTLETAQRLRDARREGMGDTLIAERYPEALPSLPLLSLRPPTLWTPLRWIGFWLWRQAGVRRVVVWILGLLERGKLREPWMWLFRLAQSASYAHGTHDGGWRAESAVKCASPQVLELELLSDESVTPPVVAAPYVRVTLRGAEVARVFPLEGVWAPVLAEQIADAMDPEDVARATSWGGWLEDREESHDHCREVEVIFGPASPTSDLATREELERLGATVCVAHGDPAHHWEAAIAAARTGDRPLVAFALPGTSPGLMWLPEALSAFDGEKVGMVFGGCLPPEDPPEPLYLHDQYSSDDSLTLVGRLPAYMVLRRELVIELAPTRSLPGPIMTAIRRALRDGWVIGHRNVRGLQIPDYRVRERGEAYGRMEALTLTELPDAQRRIQLLAKGLARGVLTLGWQALKQHGRLSVEQRELASGMARGVAATLLDALRGTHR